MDAGDPGWMDFVRCIQGYKLDKCTEQNLNKSQHKLIHVGAEEGKNTDEH